MPGFVVKIKKLLETVCHNCGLILADYVSLPREDGHIRV
jgi:DNA-directed RNA polymerase II subunit RPB1